MFDRHILSNNSSSVESTINDLSKKINKLDVESVLLENRLIEKIDSVLTVDNKCYIEGISKIDALEEKIDDIDKKIEKKSKLAKLLFVSRFI